jgi:hypothetical protein
MKERQSLPRIPRGLGAFLIDLKSEVSFSPILGFQALLFSTVANLRPQKFLLKFMRTGIAQVAVMTRRPRDTLRPEHACESRYSFLICFVTKSDFSPDRRGLGLL